MRTRVLNFCLQLGGAFLFWAWVATSMTYVSGTQASPHHQAYLRTEGDFGALALDRLVGSAGLLLAMVLMLRFLPKYRRPYRALRAKIKDVRARLAAIVGVSTVVATLISNVVLGLWDGGSLYMQLFVANFIAVACLLFISILTIGRMEHQVWPFRTDPAHPGGSFLFSFTWRNRRYELGRSFGSEAGPREQAQPHDTLNAPKEA